MSAPKDELERYIAALEEVRLKPAQREALEYVIACARARVQLGGSPERDAGAADPDDIELGEGDESVAERAAQGALHSLQLTLQRLRRPEPNLGEVFTMLALHGESMHRPALKAVHAPSRYVQRLDALHELAKVYVWRRSPPEQKPQAHLKPGVQASPDFEPWYGCSLAADSVFKAARNVIRAHNQASKADK